MMTAAATTKITGDVLERMIFLIDLLTSSISPTAVAPSSSMRFSTLKFVIVYLLV